MRLLFAGRSTTVRQILKKENSNQNTTKMKKTFLALALAAGLVSAKADTYNIGDGNSLYLGFYAADEVSTRSVIVNLGRSADVFNGISLNQSALGSVLSSTYGAGWFNNSQVFYSLFGYNGNYGEYGNVYVGRDSTQPVLQTSVMGDTSLNDDKYYAYSDAIGTVLANHQSGGAELSYVTGSTGHVHQFSVVDNSPVSFSGRADRAWNLFTSPVYAQVVSNLSIQEFVYDGSVFETTQSGSSTTVYVQNTGGVVSVVPEPSTYALIGIAALLFVVAYRRKTV